MRIALYPGTFDPPTYGHFDVLNRACQLFDKVIVGLASNTKKEPLFSKKERIDLIKDNLKDQNKAEVIAFESLTVDFAKKIQACAIIRGLRAVSDFEYEFQLAQMNRHMDGEIETLFLMPSQDYFYTSSQLIKSISAFSPERITDFVPKNVLEALKNKFQNS